MSDGGCIRKVVQRILCMKIFSWLIILGLSFACVSCAKKKHPDPELWNVITPQATIISVNVTEQTDTGFRVEAVVELTNENRVPLPLLDIHYTVTVENAGSVSVLDDANRTIPAHGKQQVTLPASFAWDGPAPAGSTWTVSGKVQYDPPGELRQILTETKVPLPVSQFKNTGNLR